MKLQGDLADIIGLEDPKVITIRGRDVEFPATVDAQTGLFLVTIINAANGDDGGGLERITQADLERIESALLGPAATVLDDLRVFGHARTFVISVLTTWHALGTEAAQTLLRQGPGGDQGKASGPETSPTTGGPSSTADGSALARPPEHPWSRPLGGVSPGAPATPVPTVPPAPTGGDGSSATSTS